MSPGRTRMRGIALGFVGVALLFVFALFVSSRPHGGVEVVEDPNNSEATRSLLVRSTHATKRLAEADDHDDSTAHTATSAIRLHQDAFDFNSRALFAFDRSAVESGGHEQPLCDSCPERCEQVVSAIQLHASALDDVSRSVKFKRLASSLGHFDRGTTHLFWQSLAESGGAAPTPSRSLATLRRFTRDDVCTVLNGDLHLLNFGTFDVGRVNASGRSYTEVVFDQNDFDHSLVSAHYWSDLTRTMTSIIIGMSDDDAAESWTRAQIDGVLRAYAHAYQAAVVSYVDNDHELTYSLGAQSASESTAIGKLLAKTSRKKTRRRMLDKYAPIGENGVRSFSHDDLAPAPSELEQQLRGAWPRYLLSLGAIHRSRMSRTASKQSGVHSVPFRSAWSSDAGGSASRAARDFYAIKSVARRIHTGLGSLGVARLLVLVEGPTSEQDDDVLLDVKQEVAPDWLPFVHVDPANSLLASSALRAAVGASAASIASADPHLGFVELPAGSFLVRARSPSKGSLDVSSLSLAEWTGVARALARLTAAAHARADDDFDRRLVSASFEDGFARLVTPGDAQNEWTHALVQLAWEQRRRQQNDFQCFRDAMGTNTKEEDADDEAQEEEEEEEKYEKDEEHDDGGADGEESESDATGSYEPPRSSEQVPYSPPVESAAIDEEDAELASDLPPVKSSSSSSSIVDESASDEDSEDASDADSEEDEEEEEEEEEKEDESDDDSASPSSPSAVDASSSKSSSPLASYPPVRPARPSSSSAASSSSLDLLAATDSGSSPGPHPAASESVESESTLDDSDEPTAARR